MQNKNRIVIQAKLSLYFFVTGRTETLIKTMLHFIFSPFDLLDKKYEKRLNLDAPQNLTKIEKKKLKSFRINKRC